MGYNRGDIFMKRDIVFKDDFTPDPRGQHPAMITIAISEDNKYMYCLTLTSQVDKYFERPDLKRMYHLVKKTEYNRLEKSSLINLKNIYKWEIENHDTVANVDPKEFRTIIREFKEYQSIDQDEYYDEIKAII